MKTVKKVKKMKQPSLLEVAHEIATDLYEAANKVCEGRNKPTLTLLRTVENLGRAKVMQGVF